MITKAEEEVLADEFHGLPNDKARWEWIKSHQHLEITVFLEDDDTYATFDESEGMFDGNYDITILQFDDYIGYTDGIFTLLEMLGIAAEGV